MKEEPDAVREEEIRLRRQNNDSQEIIGLLKVTFQVERAKLRNEEF